MGARRLAWMVGLSLVGASSGAAGPALACGGCFAPVTADATPSFVTGHRMAFAVSPTQTVLWDQFEYSGAPEDFSWVLPVRPGAYLELADAAWLDALDTFTTPVIVPPQVSCPGPSPDGGSGCGCGAMSAEARGADDGPAIVEPPDVVVVRQETVGPYDTVVLSSDDPAALSSWLIGHGYSIPDNILPVIEAYVTEGNDFLAVRLSPGQGVNQMEPVRVVTPGGDYLLPLRMVAAGVGAYVSIKLFVIAEARYTMPDLYEVTFPAFGLSYDFLSGESNFEELRLEALTQNSGKSYLVTYAQQRPFSTENLDPFGRGPRTYPVDGGVAPVPPTTLAATYFAMAKAEAGLLAPCVGAIGLLASLDRVVPCVGSACMEPAEGVSGEGGASGSAGFEEAPGTLASARFVCDGHSDLARALEGMRPGNVWLTRMEMNLPFAALGADCAVEPATGTRTRSVFYGAQVVKNPPCDGGVVISTASSLGFAAWCATGLFVRRRRRAAPRS